MREIRFRVWDIQNERMVYDPDRFEPSYHDYEKKISPWAYYETWQDRDDGIRRSCEVMQFVGLIDKNKKDVYESDIMLSPKGRKYVLKYDQASFKCFDIEGKVLPYAINSRTTKAWIVIGNIYENPELLQS